MHQDGVQSKYISMYEQQHTKPERKQLLMGRLVNFGLSDEVLSTRTRGSMVARQLRDDNTPHANFFFIYIFYNIFLTDII